MTQKEHYEILKKNYILKAESHLKLLEESELEHFEQMGTKGDLANSRQEAVTSYTALLEIILSVKVKI